MIKVNLIITSVLLLAGILIASINGVAAYGASNSSFHNIENTVTKSMPRVIPERYIRLHQHVTAGIHQYVNCNCQLEYEGR